MGRKNKNWSRKPPQKKSSAINTAIPSTNIRSALQQGMALLQSGRLQDAEQAFQSVLAVDPKNVHALQFLGIILFQSGRLQEGEQLLRRAIKQNPDMADLYYNLGMMLDRQGKLEEAVAAYRRTLRQGQNNEWVYNNLGIVLSKLERIEEAEATILKALEVNPDNPSILSNFGLILWKLNKLDDASRVLKQALDIDPRCVDALTNMGIICLAKTEIDEAARYLRRAVEIDSHNYNAVYNLAVALLHKDEDDEALTMSRKALELSPDSTDVMLNMAKVHVKKDDEKEAEATYNRILEIAPGEIGALVGLGRILSEQGRLDGAMDYYRQALDADPTMISARVGLIDMDPPDVEDKKIKELESVYEDTDVSEEDRIRIAFCLGRTYEKAGQYDRAFKYLDDGNRFKRESYKYCLDSDREFFNKIKHVFCESFFQERSGSGFNDETPIFILGMPRSGTTLTEQILSSHPKVYGAGELPEIRKIVEEVCNGEKYEKFPEVAERLSVDDFNKMGKDYIDVLRTRDNSAERVTDKMPHNFLHVGMIRLMLPNAKVIHCRRDPIDNCLSIFKQNFVGVHKYAYDQRELGSYHLLYQDLMDHWHSVLPGFMFDLQYEDMVADQEGMTRRLLEFCDLPWDDNCLQFHKSGRTVKTASYTQVRKKIYSDSVELWRRYEQELRPLIAALSGESGKSS